MRLFIKKYDNDKTFAIETTDDGKSIRKEIEGSRRVGQRISAYIEALSDESEEGVDRLLSALELLKAEAEKRKKVFAERAAKKRSKSAA